MINETQKLTDAMTIYVNSKLTSILERSYISTLTNLLMSCWGKFVNSSIDAL